VTFGQRCGGSGFKYGSGSNIFLRRNIDPDAGPALQGFDDQKIEKIYSKKKNLDQILQFTYP
jgi:hypothetical protein